VPLNVPLVPSLDKAIGPLSIPFVKRHTLVGLLFSTVRSMLKHKDVVLRRMAISLLRVVIAKHDLDPRYAGRAERARVAMLYVNYLADSLLFFATRTCRPQSRRVL
jgi:hypothetical protein